MSTPRLAALLPTAAALLALAALATGCQINTHKNDKGDNVDIATPFGGLSVKTDQNATASTGITVYPGAQLIPKDHDGDNGAADINMSFGKFSLRVKAASYRTPDTSDKVLAFYKKDLNRFGTVIQCRDNQPVDQPTRTADGLTCDNDKENHITVARNISGKLELKTGSKQHQHIVAIDPQADGTKIGLVALDLPGKLPFNLNNDDDDHKQ